MNETHDAVGEKWLGQIAAAGDRAALEAIRVAALGRGGEITGLLATLGKLPAEERKVAGQRLNALKERVAAAIAERGEAIAGAALSSRLAAERQDVTLPARPEPEGRIHPVSQVMDEIVAVFAEMGFEVAEGPDIEDDFHNFTALNLPPEHPARQAHDTFYFPERALPTGRLLRTHTSPVQIRAMMREGAPIRLIAPGRVYRCDSDMTHTPMFHQVEGLVIGADITMGHLKGCLRDFCEAFFEVADLPMRFRPSYFPFTSPSAEVDIGCSRAKGQIRIGEGSDWLEILGCGMVHPKVLAMGGIDPDRWQGFAFGMGIDRIAMLKYGIPDLRAFFDADARWLAHYGFAADDVPTLFGGLAR
jgi:phenylalanyl-tRNA synthetase alpha chain